MRAYLNHNPVVVIELTVKEAREWVEFFENENWHAEAEMLENVANGPLGRPIKED